MMRILIIHKSNSYYLENDSGKRYKNIVSKFVHNYVSSNIIFFGSLRLLTIDTFLLVYMRHYRAPVTLLGPPVTLSGPPVTLSGAFVLKEIDPLSYT